MKRKTFFIFVLFASYFMFHLSFVHAQQISLSISPPILKFYIKPGKSIMIAYRITNDGDPTIMATKVLPFEPRDNTGNIRIKNEFEGPVRFSLDNADITLEQPFFLKTRDSQQLLLRIRIPDGAPEGDYYYTLLAESQPPPTLEGVQSAGAKATIGSNILITVTNTGVIDVKGKVALFDVLPRYKMNFFGNKINIFDSNDKIPVVLIVENNGKNVITPEGEIKMKGGFGETAKYDIIPQNVLSQSQRLMTASNSAELDCPERGKQPVYCRQPITLLISGFFAGLYRLSTTINFGENSPNVFGATAFVAIPFKLTFGLLISIVIGIVILKKIMGNKEE